MAFVRWKIHAMMFVHLRTKVTWKVDHGVILEMCPSHIAIHRQLSVTFWLLSNGFWVCDVFNSTSIIISYHFFSILTTVKVIIYM